jgi:prevent-host-death family protein
MKQERDFRDWQMQEAKARLSHVVACTAHKPQWITKHGKKIAVLLSRDMYNRMCKMLEAYQWAYKEAKQSSTAPAPAPAENSGQTSQT